MKNYTDERIEQPEVNTEPECGFCWDKRKKKDIELYFFDRANNMRPCAYCPICGRKYEDIK